MANAGALASGALEKIRISRPAELGRSGADDVAFFFSRSYQTELPDAAPGILITGEPFVRGLEAAGLPLWRSSVVVVCADPYLAMAQISRRLAPGLSTVAHVDEPLGKTEVHPGAVVASGVELGEGVQIGPGCVIEDGARIGSGTRLYPGCYVGRGSLIGSRCVIFPRVTLYERTEIGDRVRIHAGVVIGADGFGYAPRREGGQVVAHEKIYHVGRVVIGNDVEIGANSCIDRGTIGDTIISDKVIIDDQVMVGHNCRLGEGAVLCGKVGLAGRAKIGKFAYIGGAAGIGNDVEIGDGAMIGALAVVPSDVAAGASMLGHPARDARDHLKIQAILNKLLDEHARRKPGREL